MAGSVRMVLQESAANGEQCIRVTMNSNSLPGRELVREYKLSNQERFSEQDTAVGYLLRTTTENDVPKTYNDTVDVNFWPMISVWSGIVGDVWKEYYVLMDDSCSPGSLKILGDKTEIETGSSPYVVKTRYTPDVIPIARSSKSSLSYSNAQEQSVSVGIVTPRVERVPHQGMYLEAEVAVDFGTSSTRVFARIDGVNDIQEAPITKDEPLNVTNDFLRDESGKYMEEPAKARIKCDAFVAPQDVRENLDTLFSIYNRSGRKPLAVARPMLDGVIYQAVLPDLEPETYQINDPMKRRRDRLVTDLKWDVRTTRIYYLAFMKQLCLHVMIWLYRQYGVQTIKWKYALPLSMDETERSLVKNIWKDPKGTDDLYHYLCEVSGTKFQHLVAEDYLSESEAASRYFLYDPKEGIPVNARKGYLVVDIGGGSTDVALWQMERGQHILRWHESVKIAGQKMFSRWVNLNNMSRDTENPSLKKLVTFIEGSNSSIKNALIDRALSTYEQDLMNSYNQNCKNPANGDWALRLRRQINLWTGMLMFSLGYQTGTLMATKDFEIPDTKGFFTIAVGGHGSKILNWRKCDDDEGILKRLFCKGVEAGGGCLRTEDVYILKSKDPKCEVARGLLVGQYDGSRIMNPGIVRTGGRVSSSMTDESLNEEYYLKAAREFQSAFNGEYPDEMQLDSIDDNDLAALAAGYLYTGSKRGEVLNVLMEVLYRYFVNREYPEAT